MALACLAPLMGLVLPAAAQAQTVTEVAADWSLIPTGLGEGDSFRLLFLSSTTRDATATGIATYNTFVQTRAAAGHAAIQAYSSGFKVVGCTADTDARDNTATTYTSADKGVPIYWLNGDKAADDYEDFYDGSWDEEANEKNESGSDGPDTSQTANYPFTGCKHDGTESRSGFVSAALGASIVVRVGRPNSTDADHGPIGSDLDSLPGDERPFYGLSAVFQVEDTNPPAPGKRGSGDERHLSLGHLQRRLGPCGGISAGGGGRCLHGHRGRC